MARPIASRRLSSPLFALALAALAAPAPGTAQEEQQQQPVSLEWQRGPGTAPIGDALAEIDLAEDHVFLDLEGTKKLMELTGNPLSGGEMATVSSSSEDESWFVVFEWDGVGYVPDDEKDSLDADALLGSIREGTEAANEERRERGWETLEIVGWQETPHYDERTNNLSWAIVGQTGDGRKTINRVTKLLGRRGVMTATLVAPPDELAAAIPAVDVVLDGYRFQSGNTYAEYVPGTDQLAKYGLTALVVGGAGAALVKSGLLAKLWKPLLVGLAALGAGVKRLFGSGRSAQHDPVKPIG
jgi:uncharacterized membrane-anchored protein